MKFGETIILDREIEINAGKKTVNIKVTNVTDLFRLVHTATSSR